MDDNVLSADLAESKKVLSALHYCLGVFAGVVREYTEIHRGTET